MKKRPYEKQHYASSVSPTYGGDDRPAVKVKRRRSILFRLTRALVVLVLFLAVAVGGVLFWTSRSPDGHMLERHGRLVDTVQEFRVLYGGYWTETFHLVASSGLEVDIKIKRPEAPEGGTLPLVLVLGGYHTGRNVVDAVDDLRGVALAAISYPYAGPTSMQGIELAKNIPALRRGVFDTPPALMLALDHLLDQPWADPERVELAGVGLGAPFACFAGALDPRFQRVWSIESGGLTDRLVEYELERELSNSLLRRVIAPLPRLIAGNLAPERYVARIAPREFVQVNTKDDNRVPVECIDALYDGAVEPKEQIWMERRRSETADDRDVRALVDFVLERASTDGR